MIVQTNAVSVPNTDANEVQGHAHSQSGNRQALCRIFFIIVLILGVGMVCASVFLVKDGRNTFLSVKEEEKLEWDDVVDATFPPSLYLDRF